MPDNPYMDLGEDNPYMDVAKDNPYMALAAEQPLPNTENLGTMAHSTPMMSAHQTKRAPTGGTMTMLVPTGVGVSVPIPIQKGGVSEYAAAVLNAPAQAGLSLYRGLAGGAAALSRATRSDVVTDESGNVIQAPGGMGKAEAFEKKAVETGVKQGEAIKALEPSRTGAKITNFVAKMPIELAKFAAEGPLAPVGMAFEAAGNKYIDAKESGAMDEQALNASGLDGTITGILGSLPGGKESKTIAELVLRKLGRGFVLGAGFHAGGAASTWVYSPEEAKRQLADPMAWGQSIASMLAYEGAGAIPHARQILSRGRAGGEAATPSETDAPEPSVAEAAPTRTRESIVAEGKLALESGDTAKAMRLRKEAGALPETNIPAEELKPEPSQEPIPAEQPVGQSQRRFEVESGLGEQADTIEALNQRREQLLADIQSATEQATNAGRKRGPEGRRIAQKTVEGLRNELADVEQRILENTGKAPEEMGWENTRQAWENLKAEMKKPGSERGAIGPDVSQGEGTADIPGRVADLVAAASKDGYRNASEWLADMRDKMSDEDFRAFYQTIGGVDGANKAWSEAAVSRNAEQGGLTPQGSGSNLLSNEEIQRAQRGDNYYRVDRTGNVTNLGPQPDAPVRNGEAIIMVSGKTGEPQVQNSQGLGNDQAVLSRFGNKVMQVHEMGRGMTGDLYSGLDIPRALRDTAEAAKRELGLPEGATDADLGREVMGRIGKLGATIKGTVVRIMSKIKGISRDVAQALAEHFHNAISGTRESQLGAIGPDIKAEKQAHRQEFAEMLREFYPGDSPVAKAARHAAWQKYSFPGEKEQAPVRQEFPRVTPDNPVMAPVKEALTQVKNAIAPAMGDAQATRFADIKAELGAKQANQISTANHAVQGAMRRIAALPKAQMEMVMDAIENPSAYKIKDPVINDAIAYIKDASDNLHKNLKDRGAELGYVENYLHHAFKETPEQVQVAIQKRKMEGGLGYMIERNGPDTYAIGRELGLTPKEPNPAKIFFNDFVNKQKFIFTHDLLSAGMKEGLIAKEPQPGWVKLNAELASSVSRSEAGEGGTYYAPAGVAKILENHLGLGFSKYALFRGARNLNNSMNQVALGLSPFHAMFISRDIADSLMGSGLVDLARHGFTKEGMKQFATGASPVYGQVKTLKRGSEIRAAIKSGAEITDPQMRETVEAAQMAGLRADMDPEYIDKHVDKLREAWANAGNTQLPASVRAVYGVKTLGEVPFSVIESAARPIMEMMVPNAKMAVFEAMWNVEKKSIPKDASPADIARRARKIGDMVEDRMGQLTYDNLNWNKYFKQTMMLATRALGWDLGSIRAIYGAGIDAAKASYELSRQGGRKLGALDNSPEAQAKVKADLAAKGIFSNKDLFTQRMGYGVASALSMAITNGLLTWGGNKIYNKLKGEKDKQSETAPSGMDYIYFRIGDKRYATPGYQKEAVEQYQILKNIMLHGDFSGVSEYAKSKASPLYTFLSEVASGKDWKGDKISKTHALASKFVPFAMKDLGLPEGETLGAKIANAAGPHPAETLARLVAGVTPAKSSHVRTDAENRALAVYHENKQPLSEDMADRKELIGRLAEYYQAGDMETIEDAKKRGLITQKDMNSIRLRSRQGDLLKGIVSKREVSPDEALDIYNNYATDDEKRRLRPILLRKKYQAIKNATPAQKADIYKKWRDFK